MVSIEILSFCRIISLWNFQYRNHVHSITLMSFQIISQNLVQYKAWLDDVQRLRTVTSLDVSAVAGIMQCLQRFYLMMISDRQLNVKTESQVVATFLAHLSTKCSRWAIVITLCQASVVSRPSSVVCRQQFIQSTSPPKLLDQFQNNFTQMFPWSSFTKIAKMVPLRWTKWPSELKIEKPLNDISSQANGPISK